MSNSELEQNPSKTIPIKLLNITYDVHCPSGFQQQLLNAAQYLDQKMEEIRKQGRVIGLERIVIMAALNITHELLCQQKIHESDALNMKNQIERLQKKIDEALMEELES